MLKIKTVKMIESYDWDDFITETYNKPYCFQQQYGCQDRGTYNLTVPSNEYNDDKLPESIPEVINSDEMGVKFESWLKRDVTQPVGEETSSWSIDLFWQRNFYPEIQVLANDLHKKGLLEAGDYIINIDW